VHNISDVRQIKVHTAKSLVLGPSRLEVEISIAKFKKYKSPGDRLCGLVVRVLGYRSGGPGSIPGTTRKKSIRSGTGCTQPREYN
jgi:hypothetical protein